MADSGDVIQIYNPWTFIHSDEFTTDIVIEEVQEIYSTGPAESADGALVPQEDSVQYYSYTKEDIDEGDVQEEKFMLRFLATNTNLENRYLWVTDSGEVRTDGGYGNLATYFEVIHWCTPSQNNYQLICYGGQCKGSILYMDGTSLKTRPYHEHSDDHDITTKFQMISRGKDITLKALISKTGIPLYFDVAGNYRPEGPPSDTEETALHPLYFIIANVKMLKVSSV